MATLSLICFYVFCLLAAAYALIALAMMLTFWLLMRDPEDHWRTSLGEALFVGVLWPVALVDAFDV